MTAAYVRVSTSGQGEEAKWGLPRQKEAIRVYVTANSLSWDGSLEYEDIGFSGAKADRPGLAQILHDAKAHKFTTLVVAARDRIARDSLLYGYIAHQLRESGVTIVSASEPMGNGDDPTSKLVGEILGAVAGYERHLITGRLLAARRLKAKQGGYAHGQAGYGLRPDGRGGLELHPEQWEHLRRMHDERQGGASLQHIADLRTATGAPTSRGGKWYPSNVSDALRNFEKARAIAERVS